MKAQKATIKTKRRRGRPGRAEASKKALSGVDLAAVNPRTVLLEIAADKSAAATARVAACRALLGDPGAPQAPTPENDPVSALALKILRRL